MGSFCYPFSKCRALLGARRQSGPDHGIPIPDPPICQGSGVHPHPGPIRIFIPERPGIGGPSPPSSPICGGSGIIPIHAGSHWHRGFRALGSLAGRPLPAVRLLCTQPGRQPWVLRLRVAIYAARVQVRGHCRPRYRTVDCQCTSSSPTRTRSAHTGPGYTLPVGAAREHPNLNSRP
jgi:hypothetical protein